LIFVDGTVGSVLHICERDAQNRAVNCPKVLHPAVISTRDGWQLLDWPCEVPVWMQWSVT